MQGDNTDVNLPHWEDNNLQAFHFAFWMDDIYHDLIKTSLEMRENDEAPTMTLKTVISSYNGNSPFADSRDLQ